MKRSPLLLLPLALVFSIRSFSQKSGPRIIENVSYGMVSGTALLMDIYVPEEPNHKAIIFIPGSAWGFVYPTNYDHTPLKDDITLDSNYAGKWTKALVKNGYTVFVINHRFSPKFQYREIIEDCRRAVRYVRYHAREFSIDPSHIGAMGHSSGGNLASMLGVTDSIYSKSKSPIDSVSSKVQAVVTMAAPFNLADINKAEDSTIDNNFVQSAIEAYVGQSPETRSGEFVLSGPYITASPYAFVTKDDAPTLIYYSDNDPVITVRQAIKMHEKLRENHVPVKIFVSPKTGHNPVPDMAEVNNWFEKYLK